MVQDAEVVGTETVTAKTTWEEKRKVKRINKKDNFIRKIITQAQTYAQTSLKAGFLYKKKL